jgi:hypothetical protein
MRPKSEGASLFDYDSFSISTIKNIRFRFSWSILAAITAAADA